MQPRQLQRKRALAPGRCHAGLIAGGKSTRLYPLTRRCRPKPLLLLDGQQTLLRSTWNRCPARTPDRWVVAPEHMAPQILSELPRLRPERFVVDPGVGTVVAFGLFAMKVAEVDPAATVICMPCDEVIKPRRSFRTALQQGASIIDANPEFLVLFGSTPSGPDTQLGFIQCGRRLDVDLPAYVVANFEEKPSAKRALEIVAQGNSLCNSGMVMGRAGRLLQVLQQLQPATYSTLRQYDEALRAGDAGAAKRLSEDMSPQCFDRHIVSRCPERFVVIEVSYRWRDLGTHVALAEHSGMDPNGNSKRGPMVEQGVLGSILTNTESNHLLVARGVSDLVIVHTADVTLIISKNTVADLTDIVRQIGDLGYDAYL